MSAPSTRAAEPVPLIVAHRGLLLHAPENTLANFRACLELRLGFEFDVQRTRDGQLVCIHDKTVDRTTNGTGKVVDLTLEEIRRLDAGSWFAPQFAGEKVPTIEEVLTLIAEYRQHRVLIAVDIKTDNVELELVQLAQKHKILDKLLFIGRPISRPAERNKLKQASVNAQTAVVVNISGEFPKALASSNADWVYFRYLPSAEQMQAVRDAQKRAFVAGAIISGNLPENWRQAVQMEMDGILTDYPLELAALLRQMQKSVSTRPTGSAPGERSR